MKIAVDAMGGDRGPEIVVRGAISAAKADPSNLEILLVGDQTTLESCVEKHSDGRVKIEIVHASEVIGMSDSPASAIRKKKDASIVVATRLHKEGKADAIVSAGNTGAVIASSLVTLGRLRGVNRPAISAFMPNKKSGAVVLDVGANSECTPKNLLQFGLLGTVFAEFQLGIQNPRVGLLNIGEESTKGNDLVIAAHQLLKEENINFIGNVEGRDVFGGEVDVVVCDGFVGNVVLKFSESIISFMTHMLRLEIKRRIMAVLGAALMRGAFSSLQAKLDYAEYGGAPLLGINGVVIISHGKSSVRAIKNAVRAAQKYVNLGINKRIENKFKGINSEVAKVS